MRHLHLEPENTQLNYVISDKAVLLLQHHHDHYQGILEVNAKVQARHLLKEFDQLWHQHSSDIAELREFRL